jgi:hypothetical protein
MRSIDARRLTFRYRITQWRSVTAPPDSGRFLPYIADADLTASNLVTLVTNSASALCARSHIAIPALRISDVAPSRRHCVFRPRVSCRPPKSPLMAHIQFNRLAGIDLTKGTRQDSLPRHLLKTIQKWFVDGDANDLVEWSQCCVAHGGDRP